MAENWMKLEIALKHATMEAKKYSLAEATKLFNILKMRDKLMETHEKAFTKATLVAYEKGVKGVTMIEFMKDAGFADAKKNLDTDRRLLVGELEKLDEYCIGCDKASDAFDSLLDQVAKALRATAKEKSPQRTAVEKLRDPLIAKVKDINEATALRFRVDKYLTAFNGQYDKFITHLLEAALKKADDKKDDDLPQPLVDKKLTAAHNLADAELNKVKDAVKEALADKDPKSASLSMKHAQIALTGLGALSKRYEKVKTDFKKQIVAAKERKDIEAKIKDIIDAHDEAHKVYVAAIAKMKKAA